MPSIFEATAGRHIGPVATNATVTQTTNKTTAVTINAASGLITTAASTIGGDNINTFTVNNSEVSAGDVILMNHVSGGSLGGYLAQPVMITDGQFQVTILNLYGTPLSQAIVLSFVVFKGASS